MTEKCEWRQREERRENGVCEKIERERSVETERSAEKAELERGRTERRLWREQRERWRDRERRKRRGRRRCDES